MPRSLWKPSSLKVRQEGTEAVQSAEGEVLSSTIVKGIYFTGEIVYKC